MHMVQNYHLEQQKQSSSVKGKKYGSRRGIMGQLEEILERSLIGKQHGLSIWRLVNI